MGRLNRPQHVERPNVQGSQDIPGEVRAGSAPGYGCSADQPCAPALPRPDQVVRSRHLLRGPGSTLSLRDDTAVLINAWEPHSYAHQPGAPPSIILALYIEPRWLADMQKEFTASARPGFFPHSCGELSLHIRRLADRMADELLFNDDAGPTHEELLFDLMIAVIERFSEWRSLIATRRTARLPASDYRIRKAVAHMRESVGRESLDPEGSGGSSTLTRWRDPPACRGRTCSAFSKHPGHHPGALLQCAQNGGRLRRPGRRGALHHRYLQSARGSRHRATSRASSDITRA